jgi:predicted small metal-binding protein
VTQAHRLDCESATADCRFIIQSENEAEAVELAKSHMRDAHGQDFTDEELRSKHLKIV